MGGGRPMGNNILARYLRLVVTSTLRFQHAKTFGWGHPPSITITDRSVTGIYLESRSDCGQ